MKFNLGDILTNDAQDAINSLNYKPMTWGGTKSVEIIGNIHENPELLK